jgi:hypothetical protein
MRQALRRRDSHIGSRVAPFLCAAAFALFLHHPVVAAQHADAVPARPRLVLQVTVDQLRGDVPLRHLDRMGEGGFRWLLEHGAWYENAQHPHANTDTIVGHASLATGAYPSLHGMVANSWLDRATGAVTYSVEDPEYAIVDRAKSDDDAGEAPRASGKDGRSPRRIIGSTFADELRLATDGRAKVFAVSVKDRGAVPMAGHTGKAFWHARHSGQFVTSTYYYDFLPAWVGEWNARRPADAWQGKEWRLLRDPASYLFADRDDQAWEAPPPALGRVFPHPLGAASDPGYYERLVLTPVGDELTVAFAKELIEKEELGRDSITDYLSVSLSSTDYVGHIFGPTSLESEDNLLRVDQRLADLFAFVDQTVGLDKTLVVLSSDHGVADAPEAAKALGFSAGWRAMADVEQEPGVEALRKRLGLTKLVKEYTYPYLTLERDALREKGLQAAEVERALAEELMRLPGVALAVPRSALESGAVPVSPVVRQVQRSFHPERSGDLHLVPDPYWVLGLEKRDFAATHGSPWRYDTHVPVVLAGWTIPAQRVQREVATVDVAPTLALLVGSRLPSSAVGAPLTEVFRGR